MPDLAVVTGAFSYTGSAIARSLRARGLGLRTLTNRRVPLLEVELARAGADPCRRLVCPGGDPLASTPRSA